MSCFADIISNLPIVSNPKYVNKQRVKMKHFAFISSNKQKVLCFAYFAVHENIQITKTVDGPDFIVRCLSLDIKAIWVQRNNPICSHIC